MRRAGLIISTIILMVGINTTLAQDIYVYPNKKLSDEGLLEYRRYTLEEAMADLAAEGERPFVRAGSTGVCGDFEVASNGKDTVALYWDGWVWSGVVV